MTKRKNRSQGDAIQRLFILVIFGKNRKNGDEKMDDYRKRNTTKKYGSAGPRSRGRNAVIDVAYHYIKAEGPKHTAEIYNYLRDVSDVNDVPTTNAISNLLRASPLFMRKGRCAPVPSPTSPIRGGALSAEAITPQANLPSKTWTNQRHNVLYLADNQKSTYPIWDINDLDEVATRLASFKHSRRLKRLPTFLRRRIEEMKEVTV